ncbi:MAG: hypothetical protein KDB23_24595 [Planctomycetales bacterium]|nr:hypothetical protein [Planctomycetales bacterium]
MRSSLTNRHPMQRRRFSLVGEQLESRQLLDTHGLSYASVTASEFLDTFWSHHDDNGRIDVTEIAPGQHSVVFRGLGDRASGDHVQVRKVTGRESNGNCNVVNWARNDVGDLDVRVNCYDEHGLLERARSSYFDVSVFEPDNNLGVVYAWAGSPSFASYAASTHYSNNSTGDVLINRLGVGHYQARFVGQGSPDLGGNVQITPYGKDPRLAHVNYWASDSGDMLVDYSITTFDGVLADGAASIMVVPPGVTPDTVAFAWAPSADRDEILTTSKYAHIPTTGALRKDRIGVGVYEVTFEGFRMGVAIATAYGRVDRSCVAANLSTSAKAWVVCADANGNPADSAFSIFGTMYNDPMYGLFSRASARPILANHEYVPVEFETTAPDMRTVNIVMTPMTEGEPSRNAVVNFFPSATVRILPGFNALGTTASFTISAGTVHVDHLRVEMWSEDNRDLLFDYEEPVDFTFGPDPSAGDLDLNGLINEEDIRMACENPDRGDLNMDSDLDLADLDILVRDILATSYGDANLDGSFDTSDLTQIFAAGKYERDVHASWAEGDWNCDGRFNTADLIKALAGGTYEQRNPIVDLAAWRIEANIVRSISPFVAEIEVVGYVRNVGTLNYESSTTQQVARLYEINPGGAPRLVASQPFANLAPGQEVAVRYTRNWDRSSPAEGEFPPSYRLAIEFDPDIAFDGNPLNDDRVQPNNATELAGSLINGLWD